MNFNESNHTTENFEQQFQEIDGEKNKNIFSNFFVKALMVIISSGVLFGLGLLWQARVDFLSIINAFYFAGLLLLFFGFIVFAANHNVFSPLIYGTKSFFLMLFGRKPKLSYFEYVNDTKDNPLPSKLIYFPLIASIPNLIVAIVLHIIYNTTIYQPLL